MAETETLRERMTTSKRDWTKGSVFHNLLSLSWPMVILEGIWGIAMALDMVWVGRLGATAVAGMGIAFFVMMFGYSLLIGFAMGAMAMVARFVGAGDLRQANHAAEQAFIIDIAFGALVITTGLLFADEVLGLFGLEKDVISEGTFYLRILFAGWLSIALYEMAFRMTQAGGDAITPMKITVFMMSIHMLLSPLLVLGWGIFPGLGVSGAALTYIISHSVGATFSLWVLFTGRTRIRLSLRHFHLDLSIIWRMVKIGLPASVMGMQRSLANLVFARILAPFGTIAIAAYSLLRRVEMLVFLPGNGLSIGAGVLVGQNLGASKPQRAERSAWLAVGIVEAIILVAALIILSWAEKVIGIFSPEPDLLKSASAFLRISIVGYFMFSLGSVMTRCLTVRVIPSW